MQQGQFPNPHSAARRYFRVLTRAWGPQHWWPAQSAFEVVVGAFLTQNTSWNNVERAIANLRAADALSVDAIRLIPVGELEQLVRPSGYFRQKAQRLKMFISFLDLNYSGSLDRMFDQDTTTLRKQLLALNGVGPETADSILLYAGNHAVFVVDAYTRRVFERHGIIPATATYEDIRGLVETALAAETPSVSRSEHAGAALGGPAHEPSAVSTGARSAAAQTYNEMHALLVGVGKNHCLKAAAKCEGCPLAPFLPSVVSEDSTKAHIPL